MATETSSGKQQPTSENTNLSALSDQGQPVDAVNAEPTEEINNDILRGALEFVFSKRNLVTDNILLNWMNSELSVPIINLISHPVIAPLTQDYRVVLSTLKSLAQSSAPDAAHVIVDEELMKVRPNIKYPRTTLILRDIPADTKEEDVLTLFEESVRESIQSIRPDFGNTWFVTFTSEDAAVQSLDGLRGKQLNQQPVGARLKSDHPLTLLINETNFAKDRSVPLQPVLPPQYPWPLMGWPMMRENPGPFMISSVPAMPFYKMPMYNGAPGPSQHFDERDRRGPRKPKTAYNPPGAQAASFDQSKTSQNHEYSENSSSFASRPRRFHQNSQPHYGRNASNDEEGSSSRPTSGVNENAPTTNTSQNAVATSGGQPSGAGSGYKKSNRRNYGGYSGSNSSHTMSKHEGGGINRGAEGSNLNGSGQPRESYYRRDKGHRDRENMHDKEKDTDKSGEAGANKETSEIKGENATEPVGSASVPSTKGGKPYGSYQKSRYQDQDGRDGRGGERRERGKDREKEKEKEKEKQIEAEEPVVWTDTQMFPPLKETSSWKPAGTWQKKFSVVAAEPPKVSPPKVVKKSVPKLEDESEGDRIKSSPTQVLERAASPDILEPSAGATPSDIKDATVVESSTSSASSPIPESKESQGGWAKTTLSFAAALKQRPSTNSSTKPEAKEGNAWEDEE